MAWVDVCSVDDLQPNSGVCALVDGQQVAIFYLSGQETVYAVGNYDPYSHANILSRGMVGDLGGQVMVASPMYKQHFNLETGVCLEDENVAIPVYDCKIDNRRVLINAEARP